MTRVFLGWGALMAAIMLVGLLFVGLDDPDSLALLGGTVAVMAAIAAVLALTGWGGALRGGLRALPDISPPTALLGVAVVLAALGAELGLWLALIGGGLALLAIGGLAREARAQRRALARARGAAAAPGVPAAHGAPAVRGAAAARDAAAAHDALADRPEEAP